MSFKLFWTIECTLSRIKQKHSKLKLTKLNILIILFKNFVNFSKTLLIFEQSSSENNWFRVFYNSWKLENFWFFSYKLLLVVTTEVMNKL